MKTPLTGIAIGAGYFSHFQYEAWSRIPKVHIAAICDLDQKKAETVAQQYGISRVYSDYHSMLEQESADFIDIITPPESHLQLCQEAADAGLDIICQKPLAPTYQEAVDLVRYVKSKNVRLMVHENFRFQPWHREIRKMLDKGIIGQVHTLNFRMRMGDGWQADAYLARQPYFRTMPRLLMHETGVHFLDIYRYLGGEISRVFANLRKLNPDIAGEDTGWVYLEFENGALGFFDGNRYNESNAPDPRYTFGEMLIEGTLGSIRLYGDGSLTIQLLGKTEQAHAYTPSRQGFAGDACFALQQHFVAAMTSHSPFETHGEDYLKTLSVLEAVYESSLTKQAVQVKKIEDMGE